MAVSKELAATFYETMCTIRCFEESVKHDFLAGEIPGFVHLYINEEAIATGVCAALRKGRPHREYPSRPWPLYRQGGRCKSDDGRDIRQGAGALPRKRRFHAHRGFRRRHDGRPTVSSAAATTLPPGAALAFKNVLKTDQVSVVFFGDGASNRGTFHEAINVGRRLEAAHCLR